MAYCTPVEIRVAARGDHVSSSPPTSGRINSEHDILPSVGTRKPCTVSFQDSDGVRHAVEVGAETLYEAAVLALKSFREHDCSPGPAAHLAIEVKSRRLGRLG